MTPLPISGVNVHLSCSDEFTGEEGTNCEGVFGYGEKGAPVCDVDEPIAFYAMSVCKNGVLEKCCNGGATSSPTQTPTVPPPTTTAPTSRPSESLFPTTQFPTTKFPTANPTKFPTPNPTEAPTVLPPSKPPTKAPTGVPTGKDYCDPTLIAQYSIDCTAVAGESKYNTGYFRFSDGTTSTAASSSNEGPLSFL